MAEVAGLGRVDGLIDTHAHLNHPRLLRRLDQVLARAWSRGVSQIVVIGYDLPSSETAIRLAQEHPGLWATVGVHPHDAATATPAALARLRALAQSKRVVAVGETGLDFHRDLAPRPAQEESMRRHLALSAELRLPVVVHCRGAHGRLLALLRQHHDPELAVIWHCFDGSPPQAEATLALGAKLGFTGMLSYPGSDQLRAVAAVAPESAVLLETDSPYLSPQPHRSRDNEPANLPLVAQSLAALRATSLEELVRAANANAQSAFRLSEQM